MANEKEVNKAVDKAVKWLASEYNYFKRLQSDLFVLQRTISGHTTEKRLFVKKVKIALDNFYNASRSERRFNRFFDEINTFKLAETYEFEASQLQDILSGTATDIHQKLIIAQKLMKAVEQRMNVEGYHLVKAASFYEGEIKSCLDALKADVDKFVRELGDKEEWDFSQEERDHLDASEEKIKVDLQKLSEMVKTAQSWITALSSDLKKAREIYRNFRFRQVITPEYLRKDLKRFSSPERQIYHLGLFLKPKAKTVLSDAVFNEAKRLIGVTAKESHLWRAAAEVCASNGLVDKAKEYWKKEGDGCFNVHKYEKAAEAYEKAEEWRKASGAWLQCFEPFRYVNVIPVILDLNVLKAAKAYDKAVKKEFQGFYEVAEQLMRRGKSAENVIQPTFFAQAAALFYPTGDYKLAGKAWVEAANATGFNGMKSYYYQQAAREFASVGGILGAEKYANLAKIYATYAKVEGQQPLSAVQERKFLYEHTMGGGDVT